ncbi:CoA-binding protein [Vibrio hannami]|uniref:CoA-binding protein n=1 Tax=Vibrio hannami TaxID=2717094 RepID=UPI00240EE049|nr:CoA-binding protein [Vibrio hannami]MDG3086068.1 CoA-binding protein [Vibrio hannami]
MKTDQSAHIAILGISDKPERFAYKAHQKLLNYGFANQTGISPKKNLNLTDIELVTSLEEVEGDIHTLTLYVGPERQQSIVDNIINLGPKRIIFNPGTENPQLMDMAKAEGIEVVQKCTLIMLDADEF